MGGKGGKGRQQHLTYFMFIPKQPNTSRFFYRETVFTKAGGHTKKVSFRVASRGGVEEVGILIFVSFFFLMMLIFVIPGAVNATVQCNRRNCMALCLFWPPSVYLSLFCLQLFFSVRLLIRYHELGWVHHQFLR